MTADESEFVRRTVDWFLLIGIFIFALLTLATSYIPYAALTGAFGWALIVFEGALFILTYRNR